MRIGNAAKITVVLGLLAGGGQTRADELRVLSAASMQAVFKEIIDHFERGFGHKVSLRYSTMGAITERVKAGEQATWSFLRRPRSRPWSRAATSARAAK